jgi:hypothetical protein
LKFFLWAKLQDLNKIEKGVAKACTREFKGNIQRVLRKMLYVQEDGCAFEAESN